MPDLSDHASAAIEAEEEAGVLGSMTAVSIGQFVHWKTINAERVPIVVDVYPLEFTSRLGKWREKGQRECVWFTPKKAMKLITNTSLRAILGLFASNSRHASLPGIADDLANKVAELGLLPKARAVTGA